MERREGLGRPNISIVPGPRLDASFVHPGPFHDVSAAHAFQLLS